MNKIIILNYKQCQLITEDKQLFNAIKNLLSYKMPGVEYTQASMNGWNGITYLLSAKGVFNFGLLPKVRRLLKERGELFSEEDLRPKFLQNKPIDISANLSKLNIVPRDYQENIVNTCINNDCGVVRAATGSGKSLAIAMLAAKLNKSTIIYVPAISILQQFYDLFSKLFDFPIGWIGDGTCNIESKINLCTNQTAGRSINSKIEIDEDFSEEKFNENDKFKILNMLKSSDVHIFDECQGGATNTVKDIFNIITPIKIYGFSGTPFSKDNAGTNLLINSIFGEQIIEVSASSLIEKGVLAQPLIKFVNVPFISGFSNYQTAYKEFIVENDYRNKLIISETKKLLDKNYVPLILFKQIKHGKILAEKLEEANIKYEMLSGIDSLDKREEVKNKLINKEIDVIVASTIYDVGIDLPILSALILAGSGKSSGRSLQRLGRGLRLYKNKKYCAVVDFYDNAKYLRQHSNSRAETYLSEPGFIVKKCIGMK